MSSSDSDDDCYGNISKKLQNMKNKYHEDQIDTTNLLNKSTEINKIIQAKVTPVETNGEVVAADLEDDDAILDQIIALNSIQKQSRRGRGCASPKGRGRKASRGGNASKRGKRNTSVNLSDSSPARNTRSSSLNSSCILIPDSPVRGQGRGRARARSRGRARNSRARARQNNSSHYYPTYSVGNTDEYPDFSDNVELFKTTKNRAQEIIDDILDENEELSIKVYWQSSDIIKFTIRKYQKLSDIFQFFVKRENVSLDKLLLTYNDKILKPEDTPDSIDYNIAKFIDGGIVNNCVPMLAQSSTEVNGIKIKFQCQNLKKPLEIVVQQEDRLIQAFTKCAEHLEVPIHKLKFEFDGDTIAGSMTPQELELEGGECIDVKIIR